MQLSLDHLTVTDATPSQLADLAAATGCTGICAFLQSMESLRAMPVYDLGTDAAERRATRAALQAGGLTVDMVYPFTLASRTDVAAFEPLLEVAAELGAPLANVLCYDRDPLRRAERLAALADLATRYGIRLAIEFYPVSQVRTLAEALAVIDASGAAIGVTLDLLHVMRGGDAATTMALLAEPRIRIAQLCDGPAAMAPDQLDWEAAMQRQLPGEGVIDIPAFLAGLRPDLPVTVEVPQQAALDAGLSPLERARRAVEATRALLRQRPPFLQAATHKA